MRDLKLLARLWPFLRTDLWAMLAALVLTPLIAMLSLWQPALMKRAIDDHLVPGVPEGLGTIAAFYLGALVVAYLLEAVYSLCLAWAGTRSLDRLRRYLYEHTLRLEQRYFDREPAGRVLTRITSDVDALAEVFGAGIVSVVLDLLMIVGTLSAMFWLDWRLTLLLLALAPPLIIVFEYFRRQLRRLYLIVREALSDVNAFLAEHIEGREVVQLYRYEMLAGREFEKLNRRFRDAMHRSNVFDASMYSMVDGASSIAVAAILVYAAWTLTGDTAVVVTVGTIAAFIDLLARLFRPLRELSSKIAVVQRGTAALEKITSLMDERSLRRTGGTPITEVAGRLSIRDLHYRYRDDGPEILKGIDLEVEPGDVIAVVGATGSGKTTLMRLIEGSYAGYEGSIELDGVELSGADPESVRKAVAGVRQDIQLFSSTLAFNVDLDNPEIDSERRESAASMVCADPIIRRLGWDRVLAERGADLSVGEGQLITFARAMAHDPAIVILDEATASIDGVTEKLIQEAIASILEAKTVLVVAHRLSTIRAADRILVLEQGEIVEQGKHDELMALGGRYSDLVEAAEF